MELGFWNLPVTMTRRGRRLPSSGEGSMRERARRRDSSRNPETLRETCSTGTQPQPQPQIPKTPNKSMISKN
jgi:hypothetical protein